ncbi:MAG: hypothetical protein WAW92_02075 [Minisyncoccia bacterium]
MGVLMRYVLTWTKRSFGISEDEPLWKDDSREFRFDADSDESAVERAKRFMLPATVNPGNTDFSLSRVVVDEVRSKVDLPHFVPTWLRRIEKIS